MDPYVPYEFEFTNLTREGENEIEVAIADLASFANGEGKAQIEFGIHPGFEAYGGIIRDVWVEVRPAAFVENVRLAYELRDDFRACAVRPRVTIPSGEDTMAHVEAVLYRNGAEVARHGVEKRVGAGRTDVELSFDFEGVALGRRRRPVFTSWEFV